MLKPSMTQNMGTVVRKIKNSQFPNCLEDGSEPPWGNSLCLSLIVNGGKLKKVPCHLLAGIFILSIRKLHHVNMPVLTNSNEKTEIVIKIVHYIIRGILTMQTEKIKKFIRKIRIAPLFFSATGWIGLVLLLASYICWLSHTCISHSNRLVSTLWIICVGLRTSH